MDMSEDRINEIQVIVDKKGYNWNIETNTAERKKSKYDKENWLNR